MISLIGDSQPVVIPTGAGAEGFAVTPDGREVWVVNRIAQSISIVDSRSLTVTDTIDVLPDARRAEISASGRVLVPHGGTDDAPAQYLSVYDVSSRALVTRVALHEGRKGPGGFGIHIVGERAFVSDRAARALFMMDLTDVASPRILATGHDDPDGLAVSPVRVAVLELAPIGSNRGRSNSTRVTRDHSRTGIQRDREDGSAARAARGGR